MPVVITSENDILTGPAEFEANLGHVETGLGRLIERWRADKNPNLAAILQSILEEVQELEDAIWIVIYGRTIDYAEGEQLDMIGRIVGEPRASLGDEEYRARLRVRIRINQSIGEPGDVIEVLRLLDPAAFKYSEFRIAAFRIDYREPLSLPAVGQAVPRIVAETRAAGVSGLVVMPVDPDRSALFGSDYDPTLNATVGFSSDYDGTVGGLWAHAARA